MRQSHSANRVLLPIGAGLALALLGDQTLYTVLADPQIAGVVGITLGMVGVLLGINRLVRMFSNGPFGYLYDRFPRRGLMIVSIGIGAVSTMCYAFEGGMEIFVFGRVLWGIAWSGIWIGSNTMALDISTDANRGRINGRLQMLFFLGVALSSLAGGLFTDAFGFRSGLWISAALAWVGVIMWGIILPETRPNPSSHLQKKENPKSGEPFPWLYALQAAIPLFALRVVFAGVLASTTILWLAQFMGNGWTISGALIPLASLTGGFIAVRVLVSMIGAPTIGALSDRTGRRWLLMALLFFIGAASLWMMSVTVLYLAIAGALLAALTGGGIQGLVPTVIGDRVGMERQSRVLGIVFTFADLGSAIGPILALTLIPLIGVGNVYQLCAFFFAAVGVYALWWTVKPTISSP